MLWGYIGDNSGNNRHQHEMGVSENAVCSKMTMCIGGLMIGQQLWDRMEYITKTYVNLR